MINSIKESHVGNVLKYLENAGYVRREGMGYLFEITPNERNKLVENFDRFDKLKYFSLELTKETIRKIGVINIHNGV